MAIDLSPAAQSDWQVAVTKHRVKTRVDGDLVRELKKLAASCKQLKRCWEHLGNLRFSKLFMVDSGG